MNPDRWKQIDELFDAVLDLPESARESFLTAKCNDDDELKKEVLKLLKANSATEKFMENPALEVAGENLAFQKTIAFHANLNGRKIGNYKIEKLLGAGGMGEVYLAMDEKLKRNVALKILPAQYTSNDERVKRFELESRAISILNHPNIVTIYDLGSWEGINYIATEFVEGKNLRELIGGELKTGEILNFIIQVCDALSAAHNAGIIHRDIKPENIMVRPDGYVKVLDFGLAKLSDFSPHSPNSFAETAQGIIVGTPAYMSPAQIADEKVDYRTDLWGVGVVLFELLTGVNPFKKENRQTTFQAVLSENPPPASSLKPGIRAELNRILAKALEKDADLSYQTAADLCADLKRARREYDSASSSNSIENFSQQRETPKTQRFVLRFTAAVFFFILLGAGISYFFSPNGQKTEAIDWSKAANAQLTEQPGIEYFPSLAPDGKNFVFAANQKGNFDIYLQRVGGKLPQNLSADSTADDTQPAFSPDGELIAFRSEREPNGIYVMGATSENLRRVADFGFHPSWSPDGTEIVVSTFGSDQPNVRVGRDNSIWIINVETGAKRELVKTEGSFPSWSPSGRRIAYWFYPPGIGRRDIAVIAADGGGEPVVVTKDFAVSNWNPVWSPDGKYLYFVSDKNGNQNFWRVRIVEATGAVLSEPEPVVTPSKFSRHLNFSRDGRRMIYVQTDNQSNIQGIGFDLKNEITTGEPFWITEGDREVTRAELSPDGKQFLMRQIRRTQDDIVIVKRDGSVWRDVTNDAAFDRFPRWSPDGRKIAFASDRGGNYEIWVGGADGTNLRQVTFMGVSNTGTSFPVWSPDGKELIYSANSQSFIINLTESWQEQTPKKISPPDGFPRFTAWDWSPDGKKIAGTFGPGLRSVGFYSFENNDFEILTESLNSIPSWLPNSRSLVYTAGNKMFLADTETKKIKELYTFQKYEPRSPFVSRDGRLLYYIAHSNESDIWLLDISQTE